jgi:hypothetical protein
LNLRRRRNGPGSSCRGRSLGTLVPEFNNEPTLYNKTLRVEASDGEHRVSSEWREKIYSLEENPQRHRIQQRTWRIGRGEATEEDRITAAMDEQMRRRYEKYGSGEEDDLDDLIDV